MNLFYEYANARHTMVDGNNVVGFPWNKKMQSAIEYDCVIFRYYHTAHVINN